MKMKCKKVKRLLSCSTDGEIGAGLKSAVDFHLSFCPDCRKEFEELQVVREILMSYRVPEMPGYIFTRTLARLAEKPVRKLNSWEAIIGRVAVGFLVAIGIGLGVWLGAGIGGNGGANAVGGLWAVEESEVATLNGEPSIDEFFTGGGR